MPVYPDPLHRRLRWIASDLAVAAWAVAWMLVGRAVGLVVLQLDALALGLVSAGRTFNGWLDSLERAIPTGIPFVGDFARRQVQLLKHDSGDPLIGIGQSASVGIHRLALILGVVVALIPISIVLWQYLPGRIRLLRDLRGVHRTMKVALRPAPSGVAMAQPTMRFLAGRALYGLPYDRLMRHSANPVLDWEEGRYEGLARAELEHHGLSLERYFKLPAPGREVVSR